PGKGLQAQISAQSTMTRERDCIHAIALAFRRLGPFHAPRAGSPWLCRRLGTRRVRRAGDALAGFAGQLDAERPAIAGPCTLPAGIDSWTIPAPNRRVSPQGAARHHRGRYE